MMERWLVVAVALGGLSACTKTPSPSDAGASPPQTLILGMTREPKNLDPAFVSFSAERELASLLGRQLTEFDDTGRLIAAAAAELPQLKTSTAGPEVYWRLAPARWEDGREVTVNDIVRAWQIESNPEIASDNFGTATKVKEILQRSSTEFVVRYKADFADWRAPDVLGIMPAHALPKIEPGFKGLAKNPLSRGPFKLARWAPGDRLVLVPNPHWVGEKPRLDKITVRFFPSAEGLVAALRSGLVDAVGEGGGLTPADAHTLQADLQKTHVVQFKRSNTWLHLDLRTDYPLFSEAQVRRDLSLVIDRDTLAKLVYRGHAEPASGMFAAPHPAHHERAAPDPSEIEAAKARLKKRFSQHKEPVVLQFSSRRAASQRAASALAAQLTALGLNPRLQPLPFSLLYSKLKDRSHAPLVLYVFRVRPDWDGRSVLHSGGRQNWSQLSDPQLDGLLDQAQQSMDPKKWGQTMRQVDARVRELVPAIPLLFRRSVSIRPRDLTGWKPTGQVTPVSWNAEQWQRGLEKPREHAYPAP